MLRNEQDLRFEYSAFCLVPQFVGVLVQIMDELPFSFSVKQLPKR